MSKLLTQLEHNDRLARMAEDFRAGRWAGVLRFLLEESGVKLCAHGYVEENPEECPTRRAYYDKVIEEGL
jgi:hypothetical protein